MRRSTSAETAERALLLRDRREVRELALQRARDDAENRKLKRQLRAERIKAAVDATIGSDVVHRPVSPPYLPPGITRRELLGERMADALCLPRQTITEQVTLALGAG